MKINIHIDELMLPKAVCRMQISLTDLEIKLGQMLEAYYEGVSSTDDLPSTDYIQALITQEINTYFKKVLR